MPKLDEEYQPRKEICGCSRCKKYIPCISDEKKDEDRGFWNKYTGPIIFTTIVLLTASGMTYCENQKELNRKSYEGKDLSTKLK